MRKRLLVMLGMLGLVVFNGCTSVQKMYPKYETQKENIKTVSIVSDSSFFWDVSGIYDGICDTDNIEFGKICLEQAKQEFIKSGYEVLNAELLTTGRTHNETAKYQIMLSREEDVEAGKEKEIKNIKFYQNDKISEEDKGKLKELYLFLMNYEKKMPEETIRYENIAWLNQKLDLKSDVVVIMFNSGRNVPLSKQMFLSALSVAGAAAGGVAIGNGVSLGITPGSPKTSNVTNIYIIETKTGDIIWKDQKINIGGTLKKENIFITAQAAVREVPSKINVKEESKELNSLNETREITKN